MVVYSHKDERILGFDKIRKHVRRSGRYIVLMKIARLIIMSAW